MKKFFIISGIGIAGVLIYLIYRSKTVVQGQNPETTTNQKIGAAATTAGITAIPGLFDMARNALRGDGYKTNLGAAQTNDSLEGSAPAAQDYYTDDPAPTTDFEDSTNGFDTPTNVGDQFIPLSSVANPNFGG